MYTIDQYKNKCIFRILPDVRQEGGGRMLEQWWKKLLGAR